MWSIYEWDIDQRAPFYRGVYLASHYPGYGSGEGFCIAVEICMN